MTTTETTPAPARNLLLCAQCLGEVDFKTRVHAAAAGGFRGIGYRTLDYARDRAAGLSDADMLRLLEETGVEVTTIGLAQGWGEGLAGLKDADALWHMAGLFAPRHVNATLMGRPTTMETAIAGYRQLCEATAQVTDAACVLEFIPYAGLKTLSEAMQIVCGANCPNGGLLVDLWHLHRTHEPVASVAALPRQLIKAVQIADAVEPAWDDLTQESKRGRLAAGAGVADLSGYLAAIRGTGADPLWEVEVLSDDIRSHGPAATARILGDSSWELLATAGLKPGWMARQRRTALELRTA